MGNFAPVASARPRSGRAGDDTVATPASSKVKSRVNSVRPALTAQRGGIQVPVSRPKSRLMRYVLPERDSACAAATTPASRRSDMVCEGCGLTGRQRGVFNHHTALWGRPSVLPRLRWSRARGVENPRTARLVHHINSDGPAP